MSAASPPNLTQLSDDALRDAFGYDHFRPLQREAVQAALEGRDALVVMPTGAGKSLCFQLPAFLTPGVTLVVSPLIALMRDQVDALNRRPAFERLGCAGLHSGQSLAEQRRVLDDLRRGNVRLLYIAPERFRSPAFLAALRAAAVARLVVDEAHCISEWGHDFRPDYLSLKDVVAALGRPPLTAVTATATRRVQESIVANLGMADPLVLVGGFNRPNLHLSVHRCRNDRERLDKVARALPKLSAAGGSGLIYVATRKQCEEVAEIAAAALAPLGRKAGLYHAGLDSDLRTEMQRDWLAGERQVLVCTNAFGMGIDKPDVRFVVHCACPDSIESYYQEAGRAGRDGGRSRCVILYHFADRKTREWFIDNEALTPPDLQQAHRELAALGDEPRLPRNWGMRTFQWSDVKTRLALGELERSGLIRRVGETSDEITLRLVERRFPPEALRRITDDLQRQRRERYRRLDEMTDYCKTDRCRRQTILDYFGDREPLPPSASCCDNCARPALSASERRAATPAAGPVPMPDVIPAGDIHALLQGLDALRPSLGRARLNKLLRGAASKGAEPFKSHGGPGPLHGVLRGASRDAVSEFLERLIAENLLRQGDEDEYFVCAVTQAGRDAWQEGLALGISLPSAPRPIARANRALSGDADAEPDADLYDALRHWRRLEASAAALPPYCIFGDRTLTAIARQKPDDLAGLRTVPGVGDAKLEKYGPAVLQVLAQYL